MDFSSLAQMLISQWGYAGIFFVNAISSSTILFPLPGFAVVFAGGAVFNPVFVALSAALGSAVGELTGYGVGAGSRRLIKRKYQKPVLRMEALFKKYSPFWVVVVFAATPLPFDVVGLVCGITRYDVKKYFVASVIGKFIKYAMLALAGMYGLHWLFGVLSEK